MGDRPSRRTFLGVGLGCAAPVLLGTPLAEAAGPILPAARRAASSDPVVEHLRVQALVQYRRARASLEATGRVPGEELRATASNLALLRAYAKGHRYDAAVNQALREQLRRDGRDASIASLLDRHLELQRHLEDREGIELPQELDATRAGAALDVAARVGFAGVTAAAARWVAWQGRQADAASLAFVAKPASLGQKPGDDYFGWPLNSELPQMDFSCGNVQLMIDAFGCMMVLLAAVQPELEALVGPVYAALWLIKNAVCALAT